VTLALLGAELGSGFGHAARLATTAETLGSMGVATVAALPDLSVLEAFPALTAGRVFAAPRGRRPGRFQQALIGRPPPRAAGMSDILALNGYGEPDILSGVVRGWRALIDQLKPDLIVSDYAPGLNLAACGRAPVICVGNGFTLPPLVSPIPRQSVARPPVLSEHDLVEAMSSVLPAGAPPLASLAAVFEGEGRCLTCFPMFDPYQVWRPGEGEGPLQRREANDQRGDGVFAYLNLAAPDIEDMLFGIVAAGVPTRVFIPEAPRAMLAYLDEVGVRADIRPPELAEAIGNARLVIHHGGLGVAQAAAEIGRPQLIAPTDAEKDFTANQLKNAGAARLLGTGKDPIIRAESDVREALNAPELTAAARGLGEALRAHAGDARGRLETLVDEVRRRVA